MSVCIYEEVTAKMFFGFFFFRGNSLRGGKKTVKSLTLKGEQKKRARSAKIPLPTPAGRYPVKVKDAHQELHSDKLGPV